MESAITGSGCLRLPRGPGGRTKAVSRIRLGLLGGLLGDLSGSVYFSKTPLLLALKVTLLWFM